MKKVLIGGMALAALGAGFWLGLPGGGASDSAAEPVPAFTLTDLNGQEHRAADYQGQVLLLNFWATWCAPCLKEMPLLNDAHAHHRERGLVVLGPAVDEQEAVARFVEQHGIDYPIMVGGPELFELMNALGDKLGALPFTVVVDRRGRIVERKWGAFSKAGLEKLIGRYLDEAT